MISTDQDNGWRRHAGFVATRFSRLHDLVTALGLALAMAGLAGIVFSYCYEVVARYFFGAPTQWSAALVSYLLLFVAFMAMPQVTRDGTHVAVTVLLERLKPARFDIAQRVIALVGFTVCAVLTVIVAGETSRQFARGVQMLSAFPVPKGWVSIWMTYGFAGSALHFLRFALCGAYGTRPATAPATES